MNDFAHTLYLYESLSTQASDACETLDCHGQGVDEPSCNETSRAQRYTFQSVSDTTYYILVVGSSNGTTGAFGITAQALVAPSNDECPATFLGTSLPAIVAGSTQNATLELNRDTLKCRIDEEAAGVWYSVRGTGGVLRASTCHATTNFDTALSIFPGDMCDSLKPCVGANQDDFDCDAVDGSTVIWKSVVDETYSILVHGNTAHDVGDFQLTVEEFETSPNDDCNGAMELKLDVVATGSTLDATPDNDVLDGSCGSESGAPGVWFFVEGTGQLLRATTCQAATDFDTAVAVLEGASCNNLQCVLHADDDGEELCTTLEWNATQGQVYYLLVHGALEGSVGNFGILVSEVGSTSAASFVVWQTFFRWGLFVMVSIFLWH